MDGPCAIGRIPPGDAWVGFAQGETDAGAYRLAAGDARGTRLAEADVDTLLALAVAYFEEAFDDGPPELQATHADLSALVRHVAGGESDPGRRRLLDEAVDAIDDGLGAEAVAGRLVAARRGTPNEQADPVDLLVNRARAMLVP